MKVKTESILTDFYGQEMKAKIDESSDLKSMTLSFVVSEALLMNEDVPWKEKLDRYKLALKFRKAECNVTAEEITLIQRLTAKRFSPVIVGAIATILEPDTHDTVEISKAS